MRGRHLMLGAVAGLGVAIGFALGPGTPSVAHADKPGPGTGEGQGKGKAVPRKVCTGEICVDEEGEVIEVANCREGRGICVPVSFGEGLCKTGCRSSGNTKRCFLQNCVLTPTLIVTTAKCVDADVPFQSKSCQDSFTPGCRSLCNPSALVGFECTSGHTCTKLDGSVVINERCTLAANGTGKVCKEKLAPDCKWTCMPQ